MNAQFHQNMPDDLYQRTKKMAKKMGMTLTVFVNMAVHNQILDNSELEKRITELERKFQSFDKK
ncbi:MAG: hypothetical protein LBC02_09715 [Planctomycetaceae bacterium]|jgi:predicted DNA-binding protein|nr:hypothetical protein [Planctomycetaceae bacterium]